MAFYYSPCCGVRFPLSPYMHTDTGRVWQCQRCQELWHLQEMKDFHFGTIFITCKLQKRPDGELHVPFIDVKGGA